MMKQTIYLLISFSIASVMVSCNGNQNGKSEYTKLVKTEQVRKILSTAEKQFPGIVEEMEAVNLAFRVAGPIQKIHVKEGDYVKKGQLIASMDPRDYKIQKAAAEAQVEQLRSEYKRIEELNNRKSVADNDFEKMKAGKEMAEAQLKNFNDQLNDTKLFAPFSGYITKVMFEAGELVNHGTPIISLIDVSQLKVEIDVPSNVFLNKNRIKTIYCVHDDIPGKKFPLELYANNIKANQNGLYRMYLYTNEKESSLTPGMNVLVNLSIKSDESELMAIPSTALFYEDSKSFVWVVNDSLVTKKQVSTNHLMHDGYIGISQGLTGIEDIVIGGINLLKDGETVRVLSPKSKTNIGELL